MSSTKPANSTGTEKQPEVTDEAVQPPVPTPAVENAAPSDPTVEKPADVVAPPSETKSEVKSDSKAEKHKEDIKVEQVAEEPEPGPPPYTAEQVYIAVMGQTGVGKSSFINDATNWALPIGHTLHACTQDIQLAETIIQDRRVVFIDTPGFDDTYRDDTTILELIGRYLKDAAQEIKLTGVLYLQRITDNRVGGCALMHMRLLKRLCGTEYYGNVVLATTHWDTLRDKKIGAQREDQLRNSDDFWGDFIKEGATIQRHEPGRESAIAVVQHLLNKSPAVLQFQRELAKHGIVGETAAGQELILSLGRLKAKHAEEVQTLREEIKAATAVANNLKDNKKAMEKKVSVMEERIEDLTKDIANLQKTLSERKEEENWKPKVLEREQCIVQ